MVRASASITRGPRQAARRRSTTCRASGPTPSPGPTTTASLPDSASLSSSSAPLKLDPRGHGLEDLALDGRSYAGPREDRREACSGTQGAARAELRRADAAGGAADDGDVPDGGLASAGRARRAPADQVGRLDHRDDGSEGRREHGRYADVDEHHLSRAASSGGRGRGQACDAQGRRDARARAATPRTAPVSASSPDGTSTASTGA